MRLVRGLRPATIVYVKNKDNPPTPVNAYRFEWQDAEGDVLSVIFHGTSRHDAREAWRRVEETCRTNHGHPEAVTRPTVTRVA